MFCTHKYKLINASLGCINVGKTTMRIFNNKNKQFAKGAYAVSSLPSQAQPGGTSAADSAVIRAGFQESLGLLHI